MAIRRGEVPFVAVRVGRSNDPREVLGLAQELRIPRAQALGYLVLWEEFILEVGDALSGRVKGYTAAHVAAKLGHSGNPRRLLEALKRAGVLSTQKTVFFHPTWSETITGQYAKRKAIDRETWRREKERQRDAARGRELGEEVPDVPPESGWTGAGRPPGVHPENGQKERKESGRTLPPAPPQAGGSLGASRWEWMLKNHPSPMKSQACIAILGRLSEEDWALVQWALTPKDQGGGLYSLSKKRAGRWDTYKFLSNEGYLQIRAEWVDKLRREAAPPKVKGAASVAARAALDRDEADRRAAGVAFLLGQLADPEISPGKKDQIRARWKHEHPDEPAPWELAEGAVDAPAATN